MRRSTLVALAAACAALSVYLAWRAVDVVVHARLVVEWSTASEVDTVGFHLYRSESRDGRFERVTDALVPAADDPLAGGDYRYVDDTVAPGRTYYYELEDVARSGGTSRHGPIEAVSGTDAWLAYTIAAAASGLCCLALARLAARRDPPSGVRR